MSVDGEFQLVSLEPAPEWVADGVAHRVTGLFQFSQGEVYNLWVEGESDPIGVTSGHPFWSVDRQDWVEAGELLVGERLAKRAVRTSGERGVESG